MYFLIVIGFCLLAVLFIKLLIKPIGWAIKLLLHALIGYAALFLLNFFGSTVGITLELNWTNALITGIFGLPGVVVLLLVKYVM